MEESRVFMTLITLLALALSMMMKVYWRTEHWSIVARGERKSDLIGREWTEVNTANERSVFEKQ